MSYSVRHQVFVSSTFTDLKDERAEVIQALWELDCIPTGMEAFVASNDSQWEVIKKVIDECDYYVLILGGRYGSVTEQGISYTEKEYRYAKKIGLPVLAFVHADPQQIIAGKSETDSGLKSKLEAFRADVMAAHPVRSWTTATELGGLVSRSLVREIKVTARPGWIRNDGSSPIALLERIASLSEENASLKERLQAEDSPIDDDLESEDDEIQLTGARIIRRGYDRYTVSWNADVSWADIFRDVGPSLLGEASEDTIQAILARFAALQDLEKGFSPVSAEISHETWSEVLIQLRALGLITHGSKKRGVNDKATYWAITPRGDRYLVSLLARRKPDPFDGLLG